MAHKKTTLLASLILATTALAQTADSKTAIDRSDDPTNSTLTKQVAIARCAVIGPASCSTRIAANAWANHGPGALPSRAASTSPGIGEAIGPRARRAR